MTYECIVACGVRSGVFEINCRALYSQIADSIAYQIPLFRVEQYNKIFMHRSEFKGMGNPAGILIKRSVGQYQKERDEIEPGAKQ
eukprot:scaffold239374_cov21-Prasinocladus_malaysianus.AAC.1